MALSLRKSFAPFVAGIALTVATAILAQPALGQAQPAESKLVSLKSAAPPQGLTDFGPIAPDALLEGQLLLRRSPQAEESLRLFTLRTRTPGDALFGQSLSPKDFAAAFGASAADISMVQAWLASHGIQVETVSAARLAIRYSGTAAQMEEAFHTQIHRYQKPDGSLCFAPATGLQVPAALAAILDRPTGMDNLTAQRSATAAGPVSGGGTAPISAALANPLRGSTASPASAANFAAPELRAHPDLLTPTLAVALGTTTLAYAADGSTSVTATLTYTGSTAPTGVVYFYDADGVLTASTNLTACTAGLQKFTCTYSFTGAADEPGPTTIYASYSGDANFNGATGSAALTITLAAGTKAVTESTFSTAPTSETVGAFTAVTITAVIKGTGAGGVPTGSFEVVGSNGLGVLAYSSGLATDTAHCTLATRTYTCTYSWTPSTGTLPGTYTLFGAYSGSATYGSLYAVTTFTVNPSGTNPTTTTVTANPPGVNSTTQGTTLTTQTTWTTGTQPTGTLAVTVGAAGMALPIYSPTVVASVTYPALGAASSAGAGEVNDALGTGPYSYTWSCAASTAALNITCSIVEANFYDPLAAASDTLTATYSGDTVFGSSNGSTTVAEPAGSSAPTLFTVTPSPASVTYGGGTSVAYTVVISGTAAHGGAPTGTFTLSGSPLFSLPVQVTLNATNCTVTATKNTCVVNSAVPATATVGTYTATLSYSGDTNYTTDSTTSTVGVTQQSPTFGTMGFAPAATQVYGTSQAITISDTLLFTGSGAAPTGAVTFTLNSVAYPASCTGTTSPLTCTATVPAATVAALPAAAYTVTAAYTADTNYAAATGTSGTFTIAKATPVFGTMSFSPAASEPVGTAQAIVVSDTLAYSGPTAPTGAVKFVFNGTSHTAACTGSTSPLTCTSTYTAAFISALAAGTYQVTASYTADTDYAAATGTSGTFVVTQTTSSTMTTPRGTGANQEVETYGGLAAFPVSGQMAFTTVGTNPTVGDLSFTSTAAGAFSGLSCVLTSGASPYVCTATFTPTATDAAGNYGINLQFTGDTNYAASVSAQTANYSINTQAPTTQMVSPLDASPVTQSYGSLTAFKVTGKLKWTGTGAAPTVGNISFTSTAAGAFSGQACTLGTLVYTCTTTFTPTSTDAVGSYALNIAFAADGNYSATHGAQAANYVITPDTATLTLAAATPGSTSAGVTSTTLTATISPAITGATVTFTDSTTGATIGTATTTSGIASITVNTAGSGTGQSSLPSGGKNLFAASVAATSTTTAASTTASPAVYFQGILFSFVGTHNFSGLITDSSTQVEGTVDGTTGTPFGVGVYNFTSSAQTLPVTLANSASNAFTLANSCGTTLAAGELCTLAFNYAPPFGDGCALTGATNVCTDDSSGYPQGTYESATWAYTLPAGTLAGLGNVGFTTSGVAAATGTLAGKAILATGSPLTVTPASLTFGPQAPSAVSATQNVTVTNSSAQPLGLAVTLPGGFFTSTSNCPAKLAAAASCQIGISYSDPSPATDSASLVLTPSAGSATTVSITGTTSANTGLSLSSNAHNFGSVATGTSTSFGLSITNNSATAATLSFTNTAGAGFTASTSCGTTLAAAASCTYTFTFAPTATGSAIDSLIITSSVPVLPGGSASAPYTDTVTVTGTGATAGQLTATSVAHNFGSLAAGTSATSYGVVLANTTSSAVALTLGPLANSADGFSAQTNCPASLAANASCNLVFGFTPSAAGLGTVQAVYPISSGAVTLYSGGQAILPEQITLTGTGQ